MSRIRGTNTSPELKLRKELWRRGLRYRVYTRIGGLRPDIVLRGPKIAIFVDGCFWHGCPQHYVRPKTREEFWSAKLGANLARDRKQTALLEKLGWLVLRFWEHEIEDGLDAIVDQVIQFEREYGPERRVSRHRSNG
jgi:DNA mismatch endonuclease (patch repair protein)